MKPLHTSRKIIASAAMLLAVGLVSGCSAFSPIQTQDQVVSRGGAGTVATVGEVKVQNLVYLANSASTGAAVSATVINSGETPAAVTLRGKSGSTALFNSVVNVPAHATVIVTPAAAAAVKSTDVSINVAKAVAAPGSTIAVDVVANDLQLTVNAPVIDEHNSEYAALVKVVPGAGTVAERSELPNLVVHGEGESEGAEGGH